MRAGAGSAWSWSFSHDRDDDELRLRRDVTGVLRLSRNSLSQNSRSTDAMGGAKKPRQTMSNGVYCVQLHLDGRRVLRSLWTTDREVVHRRAGKAMAELAAAHKDKQLWW